MLRKSQVPRYEDCNQCPSRHKGIFCDLESKDLDQLSQQKVTNIFKKGQTLFVEGSPPYGLYCISKGNIKVTKTSSSGKEAIVRIATDGDILGHRSLFSEQSHCATATALEDTSVCFIDKKFIVKLVRENPSVACRLISKLGQDLGASESKVASFSQKNTFERTCELLLILNKSHGSDDVKGRRLGIQLTREEMAAMVGTATETLIRIFSDLKKENVIEQDRKVIYLTDLDKLSMFANLEF